MPSPFEDGAPPSEGADDRATADSLRAELARLRGELAAVQAERDFFFAGLEHVPVGLELYDAEGFALWLNRAMVEFTGLPSAEVAVKGRFNVLTDPFSTRTGMVDYFRRAYAGEVVRTREFAINLEIAAIDWGATGKQICFRMVLCPQRDASGRVQRVLAVMYEVTQHHVARRVAERFLLAGSTGEAAEIIARELAAEPDILRAELWRAAEGDGTLRLAARGGPSTDGAAAEGLVREAFEGAETRVWLADDLPADGGARRLDAVEHVRVAAPIKLADGVEGVLAVATSSRYLGAQALPGMAERLAEIYAEFCARARAERSFAALFEHSPDPTLVVDEAGAVLAANERARALCGAKPTDLAGLFLEADGLAAQRAAALRGDLAAGLAWREMQLRGPGGEAIPVEVALAPLEADAATRARRAVLVARDLRERRRLDAELRRSLEEKSTLLREVHHRVKNNLQIVSSLVNMQAARITDAAARAALTVCAERVHAMALVHRVLYGGEQLGSISLADYARELSDHLRGSIAPDCAIRFELAPVQVSLEDAVPCGLILNELVTNAVKHGRGPDGAAAVTVRLAALADGFELSVVDAGPGYTLGGGYNTLGVKLIQSLARQLRATLRTTLRSDGEPAAVCVTVRR
jgi:PAS domain S-box-containing protein